MDVAVVETETFFGEAYGPVWVVGVSEERKGKRRGGRGVLCIGMKTGFCEDVRI